MADQLCVLIVDDQVQVLSVMETMLLHAGYAVLTAVDIKSALRACQTRKVVAALVDYFLPEGDGYQLALLLRQMFPEIRVALVSALLPDQMKTASVVGELPFLQKPFTSSGLVAFVGEVLADAQTVS